MLSNYARVVLVILLYIGSVSADEKTDTVLFLGNSNIPPMIYLHDARPEGLVIDLVHALAKKSGLDYEIRAMEWSAAQKMVAAGKADALLQINKNKEREALYDFSSRPLLESHFSIFRKDSRVDIHTIRSLFGRTVGVESRGYPVMLLQKYPRVRVRIIESWKEGFALVNSGVIDAVIVDRWVGEYELYRHDIEGITVVEKPVETSYSYIAVKKGNSDLLERIDRGLEAIEADGTRERILDQWRKKEVVYLSREHLDYYHLSLILSGVAFLLFVIVLSYARKVKRINKRLQASERLYEQAQAVGKTGHWKLDVHNETLTWSNQVYRIFGLPPSQAVHSYEEFLHYVHPEDREAVNTAYTDSVQEKRPYHIDHRIIRKDGSVRFVEERCEHRFNDKGEVIESVGTILDITELKEAHTCLEEMNKDLAQRVEAEVEKRLSIEAEKQAKEALLIQQSKMAAMGEMVGAIIHQWRQPLNIIGLLAQELGEAYEYDELDRETVGYIESGIMKQVSFMSQTAEDFRNFFKPSKEKTSFTACESVLELAEMFKKQFSKKSIEIVISPHKHFKVYGYPNEFKQVVLNILNNARDAIVEKGIKNGRITCDFEIKEGWGIIRIRDNGGGIPESLLPDKLFDPYISTKGEGGTGIGLQISKTIVEENMGGKLRVHNVEEGAEFVVELPLAKEQQA